MMTLITAIKILVLAVLFVISGGALFTEWARKHKVLVFFATLVSIAAAYYLFRDVYNDLKRDVANDVVFGDSIRTETDGEDVTGSSYRDEFTAESFTAEEIRLKIGESQNGWTYSDTGFVEHNGEYSGVLFAVEDVPEILVSQPNENWAAVIGYDIDGMWKYFVVDLKKKESIVSSGPPKAIFWSPNLDYFVAFTSYEGATIERVRLSQLDIKKTNVLMWHDYLLYPRRITGWTADDERFLAVTDVSTNPWDDSGGRPSIGSVPVNTFVLEVRLRDLGITIHESPLSQSN